MRRRLDGIALCVRLLAVGAAYALAPAPTQTHGARSAARIAPVALHMSSKHWQTPPTTADCTATAALPRAAPAAEALQPQAAVQAGPDRQGPHHRDRRRVRLPDREGRPGEVRR